MLKKIRERIYKIRNDLYKWGYFKTNPFLRAFGYIVKPNPAKQSIPEAFKTYNHKSKKMLGWNVYETSEDVTYHEHVKKYHFIHYFLKTKIIIPGVIVLKWLARKYIKRKEDIPDEPHNRFIRAFDDAFEQAIEDWHVFCLRNHKYPLPNGEVDTISRRKKQAKDASDNADYLRTMKEIVVTVAWHDTAYREFLNCLFFAMIGKANELSKEYPEFHHLALTNNVHPVHWYKMYPTVSGVHAMKKEKYRVEPIYNDEEKERAFEEQMKKVDAELAEKERKEREMIKKRGPCQFKNCNRKRVKGKRLCNVHGGGGLRKYEGVIE